jgi:hypothetical protein
MQFAEISPNQTRAPQAGQNTPVGGVKVHTVLKVSRAITVANIVEQ